MVREDKIFFRMMKKDPMVVNIFQDKKKLVGLNPENQIRYVYVRPKYRNKGICSDLIDNFYFDTPTPQIINMILEKGKCPHVKDNYYHYYNNVLLNKKYGFELVDFGLFYLLNYSRYKGKDKFHNITLHCPKFQFDRIEEVFFDSLNSNRKSGIYIH